MLIVFLTPAAPDTTARRYAFENFAEGEEFASCVASAHPQIWVTLDLAATVPVGAGNPADVFPGWSF